MRKKLWLFVLAVTGPALLGNAPVSAATARYDVSYLWHTKLDSVYHYRKQVSQVLGPAVAKDLKVARKPGLYGLIYYRRGDSQGAHEVARTHTRLLRSRGLEAAAPIRTQDWVFVYESGPQQNPASARKTTKRYQWNREIKDLEAAVEDYIKHLRGQGKIGRDERTAWSVYDFTSGKKLVGINDNLRFQAASLVKPFFAMAFFDRVDRGSLIYGPKSRKHMRRMIHYSNNGSTNWVMRHVGGPANINRLLTQKYPAIFKDTQIVEYIPANGRTYRNKASVDDYSRFLYALWREDIPGAREIKRLMALPGPDRLSTGTDVFPEGTEVYNKTGSTARLCGDMGILVVKGRDGKQYPYALVGVIEKQQRAPNYTSWIRARSKVIRQVSSLVYRGFARHYQLDDARG